ncbi:MAG: hypothetical protein IT436_10895 [Phycisphaerales bacterium]|nr:hypothetical protein [Phycisphaerales bacterium]
MNMTRRSAFAVLLVAITAGLSPGAARADDRAREMASKAAAYLKAQQDPATGGWSVNPDGPSFPAISALVIRGLISEPGATPKDEAIAKGVAFILKHRQPDGGIYDKVLPSYNTAISLSALAKIDTPEARAAIKSAQEFLKSLQFSEAAVVHDGLGETAKPVTKADPFYGGWGYGKHGRPDLSNTGIAMQGLHDSGIEGSDEAMQRAIIFLQRVQMAERSRDGTPINDMDYARGSKQGGFIYATSVNKDQVGIGQTNAAMIEETLDDGTKVSRLRAYGSMSYSGFKSYLYAQLPRNDPRVTTALDWMQRNYTLEENPGVGTDGLYYYFVVFSSGLAAWGEPTIDTIKPDGTKETRDWRADLVKRLAELQEPDGSFKSVDDRWMEDNKVLITAYALWALQRAEGR